MRIEIDGIRYEVSMKWYQNDTIDHYVEIDDVYHLLEDARMVLDLESDQKLTQQELRDRLEHEIRKKLDVLAGNRRT